jgi:hypothetical protein
MIIESFIYLYSLELKFFEIKQKAAEEFQELKRNKNYAEYIEDLTKWFNERKDSLDYFNLHLRKFLERLSIAKNDKTGEITVKFSINKIFLEVLAGKKISYQAFNYSPLHYIKGNAAQLIFVQWSFAPKKVVTEEYLFDLLDLKKSRRKYDKVRTVKKALEDLKDFGFSYKHENNQFYINNKKIS